MAFGVKGKVQTQLDSIEEFRVQYFVTLDPEARYGVCVAVSSRGLQEGTKEEVVQVF